MAETRTATAKTTADTPMSAPAMRIRVYSPFKVFFDEQGTSISAINDTGPFDILPHHHNFITLLGAGDLVVRPMQGKSQTIRISGGIMHVKQDDVVVFLDV
jgi:F0F1-type ATP synthase epsilon subunit